MWEVVLVVAIVSFMSNILCLPRNSYYLRIRYQPLDPDDAVTVGLQNFLENMERCPDTPHTS